MTSHFLHPSFFFFFVDGGSCLLIRRVSERKRAERLGKNQEQRLMSSERFCYVGPTSFGKHISCLTSLVFSPRGGHPDKNSPNLRLASQLDLDGWT